VIAGMNRLGMVVDMSHSAERSTLDAIEISTRPIAITHANSAVWEPVLRNKSDTVLAALAGSGGMLGFSLYPHHLEGKTDCRLEGFCAMVVRTAEIIGTERIGIGSDLVQGHPDSLAHWMRNGRWSRDTDYGEGDESRTSWPVQPVWFKSNCDFGNIVRGLAEVGFTSGEVDRIMGENWLDFLEASFEPTP
jgi:microsomal dipeptidase-like Zn-dependent dipeptidase